MEVFAVTADSPWREKAVAFAEGAPWAAAPGFAARLREYRYEDYEAPIIAVVDSRVAGFCCLSKTDWLAESPEEPWTGAVFVGEAFRGQRISGQMVAYAESLAKAAGFSVMHIATGEVGLYEKYGYREAEKRLSVTGIPQRLLVKDI